MSTYYVDALSGRDRHSGRTPDRPWKTLRRAMRQRLRPGDRVLLRRARVWTEPLRIAGSGTAARPIVIGSYGAGPKPRIRVRNVDVVANHGPVSWWTIRQLDLCGAAGFDPHGQPIGKQNGIALYADAPSAGLTIDECVIHDVSRSGIAIHAGRLPQAGFAGWRVLDTEVFNASTGITCGGPWPPGPDPWRYHRDFAVRNCRTHDIGTDGIVLSHCRDGVIEHCAAWRTGIGITKRTPVGIWFFQARNCVIQYCESFDNHTAGGKADGGGFDLDGGAVDCVMQYNYSHDNDGAGYLICSYDPKDAPCTGCVTRFNLSVNDGRMNDYPAILFWQAYDCRTYNNTCVTRIASPLKFTSDTWGHLIANNLFIVDGKRDVPLVKSAFDLRRNEFRNNVYWTTKGRPTFDVQDRRRMGFREFESLVRGTGERLVNPRLVGERSAVGLPAGSSLFRAGLRVPGMGARDLGGRLLPGSGPVPVGARLPARR